MPQTVYVLQSIHAIVSVIAVVNVLILLLHFMSFHCSSHNIFEECRMASWFIHNNIVGRTPLSLWTK
jgi:hypothetical protein